MTPAEIIAEACATHSVMPVLLKGGDRTARTVGLRRALAFRLVIEEGNAPAVIAPMIGFADRTGARNAALVEGRARGFKATTIPAMRRRVWDDAPADDLDWTKLAYRVAGWREREALFQDQAAKRADVARRQIVAAERGESVSAYTLLKLCDAIALDPRDLLPSHEARTAEGRTGKHQEPRTGRRPGPGNHQEARSAEGAIGKHQEARTAGAEGPRPRPGQKREQSSHEEGFTGNHGETRNRVSEKEDV